MAKNEAKIKFTAETSGFNDAIKKANDEMSELRAEMKLNETQMKTTGTTIEGLQNKHKILSNQLEASESKTEALNQKVNKAVEIFGENSTEVSKLRTQLLNAQTAEEKIRQAINQVNNELKEQQSAADESRTATDRLTDKIEEQQTALDKLKEEYVESVLQSGKNSRESKELAKQIKNLSGELKDSKSEMADATSKANKLDRSLDDAGNSAEDAGDGFTVLKGTVADLASNAIQAAIGKISEFIGYLSELPAETMEIRQDMATLTTSFDNVGMSTDTAKNTWKELYAVFGEDDRAVETANHIAKIAENQEDLNDWVTITTGVWGTYQDSLPVEGLAEAANETAKTGSVTGVLADALNWSSEAASMFAKYMSDDVVTAEDAFNVALSECNTEQERQQLITDTLTALYGDAADTYRDTASAQMEAKETTAENILAENSLADALEPVTTKFQELRTQSLERLVPVVEKVSSVMLDALDWMEEHPVAMKVITAVVGVLAAALATLTAVVIGYTVAQWAMNSAILANPITWVIVGIVAAIAAVVAIIVLVIEYWDQIVEAVKSCVASITEAWNNFVSWLDSNIVQPVKQFFSDLWNSITETASDLWEGVKETFASFVSWIDTDVVQPVVDFFTGLWDSMKEIWNKICDSVKFATMLLGSIIDAAVQLITLPFRFIWENCKEFVFDAWEWIKEKVSTAIENVKTVITNVMTGIQTVFTNIWTGIKTVFTNVWNSIVNFVTPILETIKNVITSAWNSVVNFIKPILSTIKNVITSAWDSVKTMTSNVFNAVKEVLTNIWEKIVTIITKVLSDIRTTVTNIWNGIKTVTSNVFNAIKTTISNIWNGIKTVISNVVNGVKITISNIWNGIKTTTSNVFNGIKSTATNVWNGIKSAILTPIEAARDKVRSIVDSIKGFFSNMKLSLPNIKLPHFKITGKLSISPPSVPKLKIDWYKDGGIMVNPTIFGMNGNSLMAGGEAGPEAILPIDRLQGYIESAMSKTMNVVNLQALADAIEDIANRPIELYVGDRQIAVATASASDGVNGLRSSFKNRGLVLD